MSTKHVDGWVTISQDGRVTAYLRRSSMAKAIHDINLVSIILMENLHSLPVVLPKEIEAIDYRELSRVAIGQSGPGQSEIIGCVLTIKGKGNIGVRNIQTSAGGEAVRIVEEPSSGHEAVKVLFYQDGSYQTQLL